ncbi:MAG: hypothetical protein ACRCZI_12095 [Cetobacterium sp.]
MSEQTILMITNSFNDEIIWESNRPLFDLYFKNEMYKKRYRFALVEMSDKTEFENGLRYLSKWA